MTTRRLPKPKLRKVRYVWARRRGRWFLRIIPTAIDFYFRREVEVRFDYKKRRPACRKKTTKRRR